MEKPEKNSLIFHIIDLEWQMFAAVQHVDGRASCQNDRQQFYIMRYAQHQAFSETFHQSYLKDLHAAQQSGRNLMTEKYAYMMEATDPDYFHSVLKPVLPTLSPVKQAAIDACVRILQAQQEAVLIKYPSLKEKSRPAQDSAQEVSALTYMAGELKTYSLQTLQAYRDALEAAQTQHINTVEKILATTQSFYGRENHIFQLDPRQP